MRASIRWFFDTDTIYRTPIRAHAELVALDCFTGPFDVLAEAFSRVAARGDEGQERGDE